jgi:hypothetical protein
MKAADRILLSLCLLVGLNLCQVQPAPGQDSAASVPQAVPEGQGNRLPTTAREQHRRQNCRLPSFSQVRAQYLGVSPTPAWPHSFDLTYFVFLTPER